MTTQLLASKFKFAAQSLGIFTVMNNVKIEDQLWDAL